MRLEKSVKAYGTADFAEFADTCASEIANHYFEMMLVLPNCALPDDPDNTGISIQVDDAVVEGDRLVVTATARYSEKRVSSCTNIAACLPASENIKIAMTMDSGDATVTIDHEYDAY